MQNIHSKDLINFDLSLCNKNEIVVGIDEAGRGALFGPVVAAAVAFKIPEPEIEGINDSKKISEKKRELLFEKIIKNALAYGIGIRNSFYIDKYNIYQATRMSMIQALKNLEIKPDVYIFDYMQFSGIKGRVFSLKKADAKSYVVACASIVAKVTRDKLVKEMAKIVNGFSLEKHKGYGTKQHLNEIKECGPTKYHRFTFKGVKSTTKYDRKIVR